MKRKTTLSIFIIALYAITTTKLFAQAHISTQSHQAQVNCVRAVPVTSGNDFEYFTAGDDGFLIRWNENNEGEHYQISDVGIKLIAVSPNGNLVAVYESDGGSVNKVSVWDWRTLTRKKFWRFSDSITSLEFSSKGTYLIVGTASVDGVIFYNTSNWSKINKIKANTGIVNYIHTSDTEKTVVFYSPAGNLSYYNMQTGQLKEKFTVIQGLNQPLLYNSNKFLAGVKDNTIYIINAYKGTAVTSIKSQNPIILSTHKDSNLYYLEYDGKNNYELKMLENLDGQKVSNPRLVKSFRGPRGSAAVHTGIKNYTEILLGSKTGSVYKTDNDPSLSTTNLPEITENTYSKILDICKAPTDFYFLTDKAVFKSSYDSGIVNKILTSNDQTNIINFDDNNIILWSESTRNKVQSVNLTTKLPTDLFTPTGNIQTLRLGSIGEKKYLIEIESNSLIHLYDFTNKTFKEVYSGTGIQDAVICDNGNMYIAKSAASNPQVPLICVNLDTYETVPLSLKGNVSFGLSTDGSLVYGIVVQSDENVQTTYVYSYNTNSNKPTNLLKFSEEDAEAFTYIYGNILYTNIGKNKLYCYNMTTKKNFAYNRSASIPKSVAQNGNRVVILNNNGSISWCSSNNASLQADWYLTTDEQWYEF
ncbi:MAG: hypothetical protein J6X78_08980 [Treponema sp.]|nr:hypothetical protein [Treponema sp.]